MSIDRQICKVVQKRWAELGHDKDAPEEVEFFKVQGKLSKNASIIALIIDSKSHDPVAVAKIPRNPECTLGVEHELSAMVSLRESVGSWPGVANVPCHGFIETTSGLKVLIQQAKKGHSLVREMTDPENEKQVYVRVLDWLIDFHKSSTKEVELEGDALRQLVTEPVEKFLSKMHAPGNVELPESVKNYFNKLADKVAGSKVRLCRKHGDFNAHNIIVTDKSKDDGLYIIDWEDYQSNQLPIHDLNHFFISNSKIIDMDCTSEQAFEKHILTDGWYKNAYINAVRRYETEGFINAESFYMLTPLYMAEICLSLMSDYRQQQSTINVWVSRMDRFINSFTS